MIRQQTPLESIIEVSVKVEGLRAFTRQQPPASPLVAKGQRIRHRPPMQLEAAWICSASGVSWRQMVPEGGTSRPLKEGSGWMGKGREVRGTQ